MSDKDKKTDVPRSLNGLVGCNPQGFIHFDCKHRTSGFKCRCPHDCIHANKQNGTDMIRNGPDQDGRWYLTPNDNVSRERSE